MAKEEPHLTTARLSAYIDDQLSPEEQAQTEAHLQNCAVCQQQLSELRQTVALLHALPQPPLPRSFLLPTSEPALAPQRPTSPTSPARPARPFAPVTPLPRRHALPSYVTGALRAVSTLAALVGIVFLLSGLFGTIIPIGNAPTTAQSVPTPTPDSSPTESSQPQSVPHLVGTTRGETPLTPTPTRGQTVTTPSSRHTPVAQNPSQAFLTLFTVSMIGTRAIIGTLLIVLGFIGFMLVRRM